MKKSAADKLSLCFLLIFILSALYTFHEWRSQRFVEHTHWVNAVDVAKDDIIASASENRIYFWKDGRSLRIIPAHTGSVLSVRFTQDGKFLASGSLDNSIRFTAPDRDTVVKQLLGHTGGVKQISFDRTGEYLVSAGFDNQLLVWDWKQDMVMARFNSKNTSFGIDSLNNLFFTDIDCNLLRYDIQSEHTDTLLKEKCGDIAVHPSGNIIAILKENREGFIFFDLNSGRVLSDLAYSKETNLTMINNFSFTKDGNHFIVSATPDIFSVWEWRDRNLNRNIDDAKTGWISGMVFDEDDHLVTSSADRTVKIWNWKKGKLISSFGNNTFKSRLFGWLSLSIVLTFTFGFVALFKDNRAINSSFTVLFLLTIWSLGILGILYFFRSDMNRVAKLMAWIATVFSALCLLSLWFSIYALLTVPVSLFFGFLLLKNGRSTSGIKWLILINIGFLWYLASSVLSVGFFP